MPKLGLPERVQSDLSVLASCAVGTTLEPYGWW